MPRVIVLVLTFPLHSISMPSSNPFSRFQHYRPPISPLKRTDSFQLSSKPNHSPHPRHPSPWPPSSPPSSRTPPTHHSLAAPWLDALENTMVAYARVDPVGCCTSDVFVKVRDLVWPWLQNDDPSCRIGAENALAAMVRYCITDKAIEEAAKEAETHAGEKKGKSKKAGKTVVGSTIALLATSIHSIAFAKAIPSLLAILTAFISRLRSLPSTSTSTTAAQILLAELIAHVGSLRLARGFGYREKVDDVLGMAVRVMGPEALLDLLPLNIIPEE